MWWGCPRRPWVAPFHFPSAAELYGRGAARRRAASRHVRSCPILCLSLCRLPVCWRYKPARSREAGVQHCDLPAPRPHQAAPGAQRQAASASASSACARVMAAVARSRLVAGVRVHLAPMSPAGRHVAPAAAKGSTPEGSSARTCDSNLSALSKFSVAGKESGASCSLAEQHSHAACRSSRQR